MQKNALTLTVSAVVLSVFGAFLRWVQTMTIFEEGTGLPVSSAVSTVFVIYSLAVLGVAVGATVLLFTGLEIPQDGEDAMHTDSGVPVALAWLCCAAFVGGGLHMMFSSGSFQLPVMQRLFGAICVAAGVCLPILPCRRKHEGVGGVGRRVVGLFLTLFFCFWLIYIYRANADNPVLWRFVPHIFAACANVCTMYYIAAWFFSRTRTMVTLTALPFTVYLNLCVMAEASTLGMLLLYLGAAGIYLILYYVITANLCRE